MTLALSPVSSNVLSEVHLGSPLGAVAVHCSGTGVVAIRFETTSGGVGHYNGALDAWQQEVVAALEAYLRGEVVDLSKLPVDLSGQTAFRRRVLEACRQIGYGCVSTYAELARRVGKPLAVRAVGSAMSHNPVPLLVPCHRVLRSDGRLGGFSAPQGIALKERLLAMERRRPMP